MSNKGFAIDAKSVKSARMDSALGTAARALSLGDPLHALRYVALRKDAPALALRGIAMAQLGELRQAQTLLRRAVSTFGRHELMARARCVLAQAEVELALRDLARAELGLNEAAQLLTECGDLENALFARLLTVRRLTLLGNVHAAQSTLVTLSLDAAPARLLALAHLAEADLAMKRMDAVAAGAALAKGRAAALQSRIPQLLLEVDFLQRRLDAPIARLIRDGRESLVYLREFKTFVRPGELIVDGCQREVRCGETVVDLVRRPVLLELAVALAEHSPRDVPRDSLITRVFGARRVNDSHRVRLRVELGRLRKLLHHVASIQATRLGFSLAAPSAHGIALLLPPGDDATSALLALLRDGNSWATSALAEALGKSQRAVQRALSELAKDGKVQSTGKARALRWVAAPSTEATTTLLLTAPGTLG